MRCRITVVSGAEVTSNTEPLKRCVEVVGRLNKEQPGWPGGSLKSKPTWLDTLGVRPRRFFLLDLWHGSQERQHRNSREIRKLATGFQMGISL
jgi:alpha-L-arabinofuranosidase